MTAKKIIILAGAFCFTVFFTSFVLAEDDQVQPRGNALIRDILSDVVDRVKIRAAEVVRKNTGVDINKRGFQSGRDYEPISEQASDETRRELENLRAEHDREIKNASRRTR